MCSIPGFSNQVTLLTLVYVVYCMIIGLTLPECIIDDVESMGGQATSGCGTEGYDNSVLSWTTDFFLSSMFGMMALQAYCTTSQSRVAGMAFAAMFLSFLLRGMIGRYFGNSGADDGTGQVGFYMFTFVVYLFWTISAYLIASLVQTAWYSVPEGGIQCGLAESRIIFALMTVSFLVIATGSIWSTLALWNAEDHVVDERPTGALVDNIPITLLRSGQLLWHGFYCVFLISTAYVWRAVALHIENPVNVAGLSHTSAAAVMVVSQLVIGCIVLFIALDSVTSDEQWGAKNANPYATVMFNYSVLVCGFLMEKYILILFPLWGDDCFDVGKSLDSTDDESNAVEEEEKCDLEMILDEDSVTSKDRNTGEDDKFSKDEKPETMSSKVKHSRYSITIMETQDEDDDKEANNAAMIEKKSDFSKDSMEEDGFADEPFEERRSVSKDGTDTGDIESQDEMRTRSLPKNASNATTRTSNSKVPSLASKSRSFASTGTMDSIKSIKSASSSLYKSISEYFVLGDNGDEIEVPLSASQ